MAEVLKAVDEVRKAIRYGIMAVDWQGRTNIARMRKERLARTQAKMKEHGIAALVLSRPENKRYATGVKPAHHTAGLLESFALVFAEDEPIVYEEAVIWDAEKEHITWMKPENYRPMIYQAMGGMGGAAFSEEMGKRTADMIYRELKERGLEKEKIGADGLYPQTRAALENLGVHPVDALYVMHEARSCKTEDEVECMKMIGAICDAAYAEVIEALRPGRRESEITAITLSALWRNGVEFVSGVTARSGPNTCPNYVGKTPTDRIIQPGDLFYMDIAGAAYMGYRSCYYRTFKVGTRPTEKEKDWYKKCRDYLYNAVDVLKAGITTADVAKKFPPARNWGFDNEAVAMGAAVGHGIGLAQYEYPFISRHNSLEFPMPIEAGMTVALETWAGETAGGWRGGCRLENVWLVTENGHENLYAMPDEEIIVPPHALYTSQ